MKSLTHFSNYKYVGIGILYLPKHVNSFAHHMANLRNSYWQHRGSARGKLSTPLICVSVTILKHLFD